MHHASSDKEKSTADSRNKFLFGGVRVIQSYLLSAMQNLRGHWCFHDVWREGHEDRQCGKTLNLNNHLSEGNVAILVWKQSFHKEHRKKELTSTFSVQQAADSVFCQPVRVATFIAGSKTTGVRVSHLLGTYPQCVSHVGIMHEA